MSDKEKRDWRDAIPTIWAVFVVFITILGHSLDTVRDLLLTGWIITGVYLLVLSWRAAYLSGKKNR